MKIKYMFIIFLMCLLGIGVRSVFAEAKDVPKLAEKAHAATVYLEAFNTQGQQVGIGSGFFIEPSLIVTNHHVIDEAAKITTKIVGKEKIYPVAVDDIVGISKENDLAVLQVDIPDIQPLSLGDSDAVTIGIDVYVTGHPKGFEGTFTPGVISNMLSGVKFIDIRNDMTLFLMNAAISPGNSGGPVLNSEGKVIGVTLARVEDGQLLNLAIPSKYVKALLQSKTGASPSIQANALSETWFRRGNANYYYAEIAAEIGLNEQVVHEFYEAAISDFDKAIKLDPEYAGAYLNRGWVKSDLGEYSEAISDFDKVIAFDAEYASAYHNRGVAKHEQKKYHEAIADFDQAIHLEDKLKGPITAVADVYHNRAQSRNRLGDFREAIADYDEVIRLRPDFVVAYYNRGNMKYKLKKYTAAIADYDKAIALDAEHTSAYHNRGVIKYKLKKYTAAIVDFDKVIALDAEHTSAYHSRAAAKYYLDQVPEAKQDWRTALKLATQANDVELKKNILRALNRLEGDFKNSVRLQSVKIPKSVEIMKGGDQNGRHLIRAHQIEPLRRNTEALRVKDWLMKRNYSFLKEDDNYRIYTPDGRGSIAEASGIRIDQIPNGIIKITIKDVGSGIFVVDRKVLTLSVRSSAADEKPKEVFKLGITPDEKPKEVFELGITPDEKPKE